MKQATFPPRTLVLLARNVRLGLKTLWLHKLRSMLTALGVIFGVGSVVAMLSVGAGAAAQAREQIDRLGVRNILVTSMKPRAEDDGRRRRLVDYGIQYEDVERIRRTLPGVARVVPAKALEKKGRLGDVSVDMRLVGTTHAWADLVSRPMIAGRHLKSYDETGFSPVVVLTEQGARNLLAGEGTVGQRVRLAGSSYVVAGIVGSPGGPGTAGGGDEGLPTPDENVDAYIPLPVARERLGDMIFEFADGGYKRERVELHQLIVEAERPQDVPAVAASLRRMFERFHPDGDWQLTVPLELLRQAEATERTFNVVLGSIAGISLLVGGIGIMNIMLASVTERTREIGVRRAIGARRSQIVQQFLIETVVLSTVGGAIGVGLGLALPELIERFAGMPTKVEPWMVGLSLGISVGVGIIFGLYPAVRAANLDPIKALRHE